MRFSILNIAALVSMIALSLLPVAVFVDEIRVNWELWLPVAKNYWVMQYGVWIIHGQSAVGCMYGPGCATFIGRELSFSPDPHLEWPSDFVGDLCHFGAEYRKMGRYPGLLTVRVIWFPIWCLAAPLLIAPILWLRSPRRSGRLSAFPVLQNAPAAQKPPANPA